MRAQPPDDIQYPVRSEWLWAEQQWWTQARPRSWATEMNENPLTPANMEERPSDIEFRARDYVGSWNLSESNC